MIIFSISHSSRGRLRGRLSCVPWCPRAQQQEPEMASECRLPRAMFRLGVPALLSHLECLVALLTLSQAPFTIWFQSCWCSPAQISVQTTGRSCTNIWQMHARTLGLMHSALGPGSITPLHKGILFFSLAHVVYTCDMLAMHLLAVREPLRFKAILISLFLYAWTFWGFLLVFKRLERGITSLKPLLTLFWICWI